jgi:hypothetical protein
MSNDHQTTSVQKRIHRGDAEYAEKRILSIKTPNSATSVCLCGESFVVPLMFLSVIDLSSLLR